MRISDWSSDVCSSDLFARERLAAGAPPPPLGIHMIGPAIIRFGTPDQHARFLPATLSGDILWSQGYSEPESGSDLATSEERRVGKECARTCRSRCTPYQ